MWGPCREHPNLFPIQTRGADLGTPPFAILIILLWNQGDDNNNTDGYPPFNHPTSKTTTKSRTSKHYLLSRLANPNKLVFWLNIKMTHKWLKFSNSSRAAELMSLSNTKKPLEEIRGKDKRQKNQRTNDNEVSVMGR